jgi:hypothetical protein
MGRFKMCENPSTIITLVLKLALGFWKIAGELVK